MSRLLGIESRAHARLFAILHALAWSVAGCRETRPSQEPRSLGPQSWAEVETEARGQTVTWMMWKGDPLINAYVEGFVAPRLRDRIEALEQVAREIHRVQQLRRLSVCVVAPGKREGSRRGFWIAKGQVVDVRPFTGTHGIEWQAGLAAVARAEFTLEPDSADDLLTVATFLRRPPPELEVIALAHLQHGAAA